MADNSTQAGVDTIRDKDRTGVKTQIVGFDVNISGTESLGTGTTSGAKNAIDVNLAASLGGAATVSGTLTVAAAANTTGTTSTTGTVVAAVGASGNGTIVLAGGTFTALTLAFEASLEGTNWFPIDGTRTDGLGVELTPTFSAALVRAWNFIAPGYQYVRVRASAITQTAGPTVYITQGPFLYDPSPSVVPLDGNKPTFAASVSGMSTTIASDVFVLTGSATKTIRITRVEVFCQAGAATTTRFQLIKRSTADTAGTTSAATVTPLESTDTATATATGYTVAPTLGTAVGPVRVAGVTGTVLVATWDFGQNPSKAPVLRGTAQQLALNNSTAIATSGAWSIVFEFTEE